MRPKILAITFALILVPTLASHAVDTLPPSLSDQDFWKIVTDYSEPGGDFAFEMYMSNEETFQEILPDLLKRVQGPAGHHRLRVLVRNVPAGQSRAEMLPPSAVRPLY